jgi:hypothetical protein
VGEYVYDLAFAFVAPLSADDYRCLTAFHSIAHSSPVGGFEQFELRGTWTGKFVVTYGFYQIVVDESPPT